jgi:hypothetical protein
MIEYDPDTKTYYHTSEMWVGENVDRLKRSMAESLAERTAWAEKALEPHRINEPWGATASINKPLAPESGSADTDSDGWMEIVANMDAYSDTWVVSERISPRPRKRDGGTGPFSRPASSGRVASRPVEVSTADGNRPPISPEPQPVKFEVQTCTRTRLAYDPDVQDSINQAASRNFRGPFWVRIRGGWAYSITLDLDARPWTGTQTSQWGKCPGTARPIRVQPFYERGRTRQSSSPRQSRRSMTERTLLRRALAGQSGWQTTHRRPFVNRCTCWRVNSVDWSRTSSMRASIHAIIQPDWI